MSRRRANSRSWPDKRQWGLLRDSGYDDSTSQCSDSEESDLGRSAISATSTASTNSSVSFPTVTAQTAPHQGSKELDQLAIRRRELEQCRQALQVLFRDCRQSEFEDICCAISCVYSSVRPLSRDELSAAINLYSLGRDWKKAMEDEQWTQLDQWFYKCRSIFVETLDSKIDFVRSTSMRLLLRNVRIPGIDTSHRTLGILCRNQMELQSFHARNGVARPDLVRDMQAMSTYVREFGSRHLQAASLTSIIAVAQDDTCTNTSDDFEMISTGTSNLSISEKKGDWLVVKQT